MPSRGGYAGGRKDFTIHKVNADPIIRYRKDRKEIQRKKERERLLRELFRDLIAAIADALWLYEDLFVFLGNLPKIPSNS